VHLSRLTPHVDQTGFLVQLVATPTLPAASPLPSAWLSDQLHPAKLGPQLRLEDRVRGRDWARVAHRLAGPITTWSRGAEKSDDSLAAGSVGAGGGTSTGGGGDGWSSAAHPSTTSAKALSSHRRSPCMAREGEGSHRPKVLTDYEVKRQRLPGHSQA
jgi:hypothetical protein